MIFFRLRVVAHAVQRVPRKHSVHFPLVSLIDHDPLPAPHKQFSTGPPQCSDTNERYWFQSEG